MAIPNDVPLFLGGPGLQDSSYVDGYGIGYNDYFIFRTLRTLGITINFTRVDDIVSGTPVINPYTYSGTLTRGFIGSNGFANAEDWNYLFLEFYADFTLSTPVYDASKSLSVTPGFALNNGPTPGGTGLRQITLSLGSAFFLPRQVDNDTGDPILAPQTIVRLFADFNVLIGRIGALRSDPVYTGDLIYQSTPGDPTTNKRIGGTRVETGNTIGTIRSSDILITPGTTW